ncbi:MAG: AAA family ATPase [Candidatus Coatesbacteria bacterium]|nr:AAA family ATPase [Candidatus Coatesbacteria bacterium]
MYLNFFNLDELPFNLTPDPKFFFMSKAHHEAVEHLEFGISHRKGFVVITGEVGSGKTTVCRAFLSRMDSEKTKTALILNPILSPLELLQSINEDLGLEFEDNSPKRLTKILNEYLIEQYKKSCNVAVLIDEAQNLSDIALEQIRLLSNLETSKDKLIQIILLGQPELRAHLSRPNMAPLAERIAVRYDLRPLTFEETCQYVAHRMRIAGCHHPVFTKNAHKLLYRHSGGIPRRINLICDKALLCAYGMGESQAGPSHVKSALAEIGHTRVARLLNPRRSIALAVAAILILVSTWLLTRTWPDRGGSYSGPPQTSHKAAKRTEQVPANTGPPPIETGASAAEIETGFDQNGIYRVESESQASFGAVLTLFRLWGEEVDGLLSPSGDGSERSSVDVWALIRRAGFRIESRQARIGHLKVLDMPCLIQVRQDGGSLPAYRVVLGLERNVFHLADPISGLISLQETDVDNQWTRRAIYIVPDLAGLRVALRAGKRGQEVTAFRARLFNLGLLGESNSDVYDANCERAVREFQLLSGLISDGIAGWRTMLLLTRETMKDKAPRLSSWGLH